MRYNEILNEMIIRTNNRLTNSNIILAHGANIWIFDYDGGFSKSAIKEITKETGLTGFTDANELMSEAENRPDLLVASYYNGELYVDGMKASHHASSSVLLKKVAKFLGVDIVNQNNSSYEGDDVNTPYTTSEMIGDIPNVVYHGTSLKFINQILKTGLRPNDNSNWENVGKFHDLIFLTADINVARFHANKSVDKYKEPAVIIETKIPDRNKIKMDYDVAYTFHGNKNVPNSYANSLKKDLNPYQKNKIKKIQKYNPKTDFTKLTGIFAYSGAITPPNFVKIFTNFSDEYLTQDNAYEFNNLTDFEKALEMYWNFGFYDPEYEPELDDEE